MTRSFEPAHTFTLTSAMYFISFIIITLAIKWRNASIGDEAHKTVDPLLYALGFHINHENVSRYNRNHRTYCALRCRLVSDWNSWDTLTVCCCQQFSVSNPFYVSATYGIIKMTEFDSILDYFGLPTFEVMHDGLAFRSPLKSGVECPAFVYK